MLSLLLVLSFWCQGLVSTVLTFAVLDFVAKSRSRLCLDCYSEMPV
jgi:hypothetical protein